MKKFTVSFLCLISFLILYAEEEKGNSRPIYIGVVKEQGKGFVPFDFSAPPYDNVIFESYIIGRDSEKVTQDSTGSLFEDYDLGYSAIAFNIGLFPTAWSPGDSLFTNIIDTTDVDPGKWPKGMYKFELDSLPNDSVFVGLDDWFPGKSTTDQKTPIQVVSPNSITDESLPDKIILYQNYPNPFNPETYIRFSLPKKEQVTLSVFNMNGQLVKQLINEKITAGNHSINFNASDLNSGIYFYTLETGSIKLSKKMLFMK